MKFIHNRVEGIKIAYIGGGSRGWAWGFFQDLANESQLDGQLALYDIDLQAASQNQMIADRIFSHPESKAKWVSTVETSLASALRDADFVVISILPGTFTEMRSDVHVPEQYGIYQSVGDTVGPGGFIRALRSIPMFAIIGQAIRESCPNAWVINYTNPMTLCMRTLYEVFPQIKAFGCCHEVFGTQKLLACVIRDKMGIDGVAREDIQTNVLGINHFTWLDRATWNGIDLIPLYREFAETYAGNGYIDAKDDNWINKNTVFDSNHRVKFDLFLRYGLIAAAGDRHLAEFLPPWYLKDPETATVWGFQLTPVDWRDQDLARRLETSRRLVTGEEEITLKTSGEEGHLLIKALLGLGERVSNVNIPNRGQISNLPLGAVVETNALFRRDAIDPVLAGSIPLNVLGVVMPHVINQENTLKAALTCDRKLALSTFMNDPQTAHLSLADGEALFNKMLENTRAYLPDAWF